uniref:Uncharacterized protein n=1 Tax=Cannabis sativa TaxID=3483 RepID=A0A803QWL1_CANSA
MSSSILVGACSFKSTSESASGTKVPTILRGGIVGRVGPKITCLLTLVTNSGNKFSTLTFAFILKNNFT